jgi:branched-chain amino acid aminotransferase
MIVCLNEKFVSASDAKISIFDHGLLYGDGVFDTIMARNGRIFWLGEHVDRLLEGCENIYLNIPWTRQKLINLTEETFERNGGDSGRIRITITRGESDVPISNTLNCRPSLIIFSSELERYPKELYEKGIKLTTTLHRRVHPFVKNLSFLPSVLGYLDSLRAGFDDSIFVDEDSNVLEGTTFNVFAIKNGKLKTPREGMLVGVTRNKVIELARKNRLVVEEAKLPLDELKFADEALITGTTKKIVPITRINETIINDGKVGEITSSLMRKFSEEYF